MSQLQSQFIILYKEEVLILGVPLLKDDRSSAKSDWESLPEKLYYSDSDGEVISLVCVCVIHLVYVWLSFVIFMIIEGC